mgnify:FL=1|jgi:hypothetical protein
MNNLTIVTSLLCTLLLFACVEVKAEQANQDVTISKSGAIVVKSQRQQKTANTNQSITISKSGGIFVIIQRNINKYKVEDLKDVIEGATK